MATKWAADRPQAQIGQPAQIKTPAILTDMLFARFDHRLRRHRGLWLPVAAAKRVVRIL